MTKMVNKLKQLSELAARHHAKISFLGYIAGVIWLVALIHPSVKNSTYFSENALLAGMVDTDYEYGRAVKLLKAEVENPSETYRKNFPLWFMEKMTAIGLESYQQNFTAQLPEELSVLSEQISGTNVYGILRAPRTARTEALVFLVPFKPDKIGPFYEVVLLLSLAEHFRNNIYWAKDIIFLVVDKNEIGIQSWLDEYHGIQSKYVKSSRMLSRSGAIQAAINLEMTDDDITRMEILVESLNGQLPNLDLVNMVIRLCRSEGIPVALKKLSVRDLNDGWDEYRSLLGTMLSMMLNQAAGHPSANHGLFPKYGIEAVTLRGRKAGSNSVSFERLGRALEGMFRSLNSLLEKFHQSFFFYLLPSTSRYVSIGLYMPPLGCVMVGPILAAVSCWISSVEEKENDKSEKQKDKKDETMKKNTSDSSKDKAEKDLRPEELAFTRIPRHFGKVLRVILAGHFVGFLIHATPYMLRYIEMSFFYLHPSSLVLFLLCGAFLLGSCLPFLLRLTSSLAERDVLLLKSLSLVIYVCQVGCLATINFSFGFFLAIFTAPAFLFVNSTQNRLRRLFQVVLLFLSSPPVIIFLMTLVYTYFTSDHEILNHSKTLFIDGILSSLRDSVLLGSWTFPVTLLIVFPNWLMFWCIAWM